MDACLQSELGRVAVAGSGFLADGYDLYVIGQALQVLKRTINECQLGEVDNCISDEEWKRYEGYISSSALWGAVAGQLIFGTLADRLGRRVIFICTGVLIVVGSLLSALVVENGRGPEFMLTQLMIYRGILGFGIGGEYPLSAAICAEGTSPRRRGTLMALVFTNQGLGYLLCAGLMTAMAFFEVELERLWRISLGFGAVVPIISLFFRMRMHESEDFTKVQEQRDHEDAGVDVWATVRRYRWHVVGTAGNWFLFDVIWYANSLFNSSITKEVHVTNLPAGDIRADLARSLVIVLMMLPGYFVGVCFINKLGRKNVQVNGYICMSVLFAILALRFQALRDDKPYIFMMCYGLTFFFANFGPNLTTYVIPGEIYPTQVKTTLHGCSAAAGKAGAALGAQFLPALTGHPPTDEGIQWAMAICAVLAILGVVLTCFTTPRYAAEDLIPMDEEEETVAFVPLRWQRKKSQREFAKEEEEDYDESCCRYSTEGDSTEGEFEEEVGKE
eukprot:TRINITY_DN12617_c0_g1_i1.p1 TRINITY_DN12617_c0_g1~~TRINITY_DN12617_c0_g1_i1.p1  ORF type:complete len:502 (-),score=108.10 TRINITY_DN12617_c0_g1_i1:636-2141(-)